jgi:hypothetical protein
LKASIDQQGSLQRILVGWIFVILSIQGLCISPLSFAQSPNSPIIFKDVTEAAGIDFVHSSGKRSSLLPEDVGSGAAFADYNNDGHIDLYIVNNPGPLNAEITKASPGNVLYRNNGDGTFTDVTTEAGVNDRSYGMGCIFGDYDNDEDLDLYVTNYHRREMCCIATMVMARLPMSPRKRVLVIVATVWAASSVITTTTGPWIFMSRTMDQMCCIATMVMARLPMSR